jgi:hypothetical protein
MQLSVFCQAIAEKIIFSTRKIILPLTDQLTYKK